jgi:hypothetical protein
MIIFMQALIDGCLFLKEINTHYFPATQNLAEKQNHRDYKPSDGIIWMATYASRSDRILSRKGLSPTSQKKTAHKQYLQMY